MFSSKTQNSLLLKMTPSVSVLVRTLYRTVYGSIHSNFSLSHKSLVGLSLTPTL